MAVRRKYEPIQSPLSQNPVQMDVVDILAHYYSRVAVQEYYMNNFYGSIAASRNALLLKLKDANAYANICAAYNALGRAEDALMAGEMAVMLDSALPAARKHLEQARALQVAVQEGARDYSY